MPPTLDLTKTYTHAEMILSSRNGPGRLNLRRAASYNASERGPLSSTSSRFSFNQLIASPPPSPGLPALVPRHGKVVPKHKVSPRRCARSFLWMTGIVVVVWWGYTMLSSSRTRELRVYTEKGMEEYEMVADTELPDFPTPVMVTDSKGRAKWTVSIPPDAEFPLEPKIYAEICEQNVEVATRVADLHSLSHKITGDEDYYYVDSNFMDVKDAEELGLLPGAKAKTSMREQGMVGEVMDSLVQGRVCEKSLTFVMDTQDAGFGGTLMMLWMSYGLAKKEGREFFVDDSRWAYGKYTTYFLTPPVPVCRPPPRHEILPCPHHARHLLVSAATASHTFGPAFTSHFSDHRKAPTDVHHQKPIFDLVRAGYEALWRLQPGDAHYAIKRLSTLRSQSTSGKETQPSKIIGVHVRRGDKHPSEFQYRDSYVPLDRYLANALSMLPYSPVGQSSSSSENSHKVIVASDDPTVYDSDEFSPHTRAQELVRLTANPSPHPRPQHIPAIRPFIADAVGWEGGFFAGMFWSLGRPSSIPPTGKKAGEQKRLGPGEESLRLRELVGRAYLLDLAVLGGSDGVVCTGGSMAGRVLGVMMGWSGLVSGKWKNVDGEAGWEGVGW